MTFRNSVASKLYILSVTGLVSLGLSGCGVNSAIVPSNTAVHALSGIAHGGPNPIVGGIVTLYATSNSPYGSAAGTALGTAVTGLDGGFTFVAPAVCTAGQQAYVTVQGGNPGGGSNPNYLLVAALGPCANISAATTIWVDEASTVAAAYALRPFASVGAGVGPSTLAVNIGAPANNNAATGVCTTSPAGATTGCVAAGLTHAFANALNLVDSVSVNGVAPMGTAFTVTPSNPNGSVPTALVNSLANSVEACVNSPGGTAGDGSNCGNLFAATTVPGSTPTNTFQAMLNVAQYPALASPTNVTNLFAVPPASANFYQPALTVAPTDYSLAIGYSGVNFAGTVGTISVTNPGAGYILVPAVTISGGGTPTTPVTANAVMTLSTLNFTPNTGTACVAPIVKTSAGTSVVPLAATAVATAGVITSVTITTYGTGLSVLPKITFTGTGCTTGTLTATYAVDAIDITNQGAGYSSAPTITIDAPTSTTAALTQATAAANYATTLFAAPYALALDANDNVYVASQNAAQATGANAFYTSMTANGTANFASLPTTQPGELEPRGAATDTLGHLWISNNNVAANSVGEISTANGSTINTTGAAQAPFAIAIDQANNVWYSIVSGAATSKIVELLYSASYTATTFANPPLPANGPRAIAFDANQNVYFSGFSTTSDTASVFPNTGTPAAPTYTGTIITPTLTGTGSPGIALDASDNIWQPSTTGLFEINTTFTGTTATAFTPTTASPLTDNAAAPAFDTVDGAGNIWIANNAAAGSVAQYIPSSGAANAFSSCYLTPGSTTCAGAYTAPSKIFVDSTGSVWITSLTNGRIYQLLGTGYPTWPQLSLGLPGAPPQ